MRCSLRRYQRNEPGGGSAPRPRPCWLSRRKKRRARARSAGSGSRLPNGFMEAFSTVAVDRAVSKQGAWNGRSAMTPTGAESFRFNHPVKGRGLATSKDARLSNRFQLKHRVWRETASPGVRGFSFALNHVLPAASGVEPCIVSQPAPLQVTVRLPAARNTQTQPRLHSWYRSTQTSNRAGAWARFQTPAVCLLASLQVG